MSNMIKCDGCGLLGSAETWEEREKFHEVFIDIENGFKSCFHLCEKCNKKFMVDILQMRWDETEQAWKKLDE